MTEQQRRATQRELRLAKDHGGDRVRGSGSGPFKKGDVSFANALLQDKHTIKKSIAVKKSDLEQVEGEALMRGKVPFFSIGFEPTDPRERSVTWFAFPEWWLKNNTDILSRMTNAPAQGERP